LKDFGNPSDDLKSGDNIAVAWASFQPEFQSRDSTPWKQCTERQPNSETKGRRNSSKSLILFHIHLALTPAPFSLKLLWNRPMPLRLWVTEYVVQWERFQNLISCVYNIF
jgi:hypothetical protein